jgi:hypothetical protein
MYASHGTNTFSSFHELSYTFSAIYLRKPAGVQESLEADYQISQIFFLDTKK